MDAVSKPELDGASTSAAGSAKALVKGLALVELVADSERPLRLVDLVDASGLPRPTALRLLDVLCRAEVLRADADSRYSLGPRVAAWGQSFLDRLDLRSQAVDLMEELVEICGETSFLGVVDRKQVLYVAAVDSPQPVRPAARPGFRNPLHCTAIGKVLLSGMTDAEIRGLLVPPLERRTENTIAEPDDVIAHIALVRERGYAIDEIENEEGVRCVAAPVRDHTGAVVAGISVSAPAYRFSDEDRQRLAPQVLRVAAELSRRLGAPGVAESSSGAHTSTTERTAR
jgi:IclR family acetate operon transcriptional repressor